MPVLEDLRPRNRDNFPLAFSHLVHQDVGIVEAFLASWFQPADMHCFYVDKKANPKVRTALLELVKCYHQKFFPSKKGIHNLQNTDLDKVTTTTSILEGSVRMFVYQESKMVFWGHSSILRAEMDCLRQLLINDKQSDQPWRYFFNLAGSELPLKSEEWARQMLKGMNGQSLVEGFPLPKGNQRRLIKTVILKWY